MLTTNFAEFIFIPLMYTREYGANKLDPPIDVPPINALLRICSSPRTARLNPYARSRVYTGAGNAVYYRSTAAFVFALNNYSGIVVSAGYVCVPRYPRNGYSPHSQVNAMHVARAKAQPHTRVHAPWTHVRVRARVHAYPRNT